MSSTYKSDYDKTLVGSEKEGVPTPGEYVWLVPDKPVAIHLNLDVVDRMSQDIMRGFGAVPRRGAEVGGILLGSAKHGDALVVHVSDYELVPIEYKRGPSYLLSEDDLATFEASLSRLLGYSSDSNHPVGWFRSNTRDGTGLGPEDLALLARDFPQPETVALLIRPFATKVSMAGFYFREDGEFQTGPPLLEFPFRRKELAPHEPPQPPTRPLERHEPGASSLARKEIAPPQERPAPAPLPAAPVTTAPLPAAPFPVQPAEFSPSAIEPKKPKGRGWIWVPLSLTFFVLGVLLGLQAALSLHPQASSPPSDAFSLSLNVEKSGDSLHVRWDRQASAIRSAERGILTIDDGTFTKTLDLDAGQLQTGSVVYKHYSNDVRFRLQVFPTPRDTLTEILEWKE